MGAVGSYAVRATGRTGGAGLAWIGPSTSLSAGNLTIRIGVRVTVVAGSSPPPNASLVLTPSLRGFGAPILYHHAVTFGQIAGAGWVAATIPLRTSLPLFGVHLLGPCDSPSAVVELGHLTVPSAGLSTAEPPAERPRSDRVTI
ncbi:MAG: hypothetical protein L3K15_06555 [Thermoplasmata archaeon]|nr:hypothetical protein [Thermoplasmata archaeon]